MFVFSSFARTTETNDVLHRVSWKLLHTTYPSSSTSTVDGDLATPPTHRIRTNVVRLFLRLHHQPGWVGPPPSSRALVASHGWHEHAVR
jgi:hypothetical protein